MDARIWGYIQGGAGAERTLEENEAAFSRWTLLPRHLSGVTEVDLSTSLLGEACTAPFFLAPTAYLRQVHPGGERAAAAAAAALGVLGVFSTLSSDSLEAIARAAGSGRRWYQLYLQPKFSHSLELVHRAERAGYSALVVTIDTPVLGPRDRQLRTGFALDGRVPVGNGPAARTPPRSPLWAGGPTRLEEAGDVTWDAVASVRKASRLPLVVKGVLDGRTARRALELGARAVVVSNHGGRQLDLAPASLDVLPEVVRAVGRRGEVYLDGGVRRGSDVLVALALGARAVGVGRPILWALAAGGRAGVDRYLRLLGTEVANSLLLLGRSSVGELSRTDVRRASGRAPPPGRSAAR